MNDVTKWDLAKELVERAVRQLNETLGFAEDDKHRVTFGYIGNGRFSDDKGWNLDGCYWSVYLPHPHRVGTADDRLGWVANGDAASLGALAGPVLAFRKGIEWAGLQKGTVQVANNQAKGIF